MPTTTLNIDGMTCDHCVKSISEALKGIPGVQSAEVSLEHLTAIVHHDEAAGLEAMIAAVEEEGYGASRA